MKLAMIAIAVLLTTACASKVFTRLVAAPCACPSPESNIDPILYEHVPEHAAKELSCDEGKRLALVRLASVQQCNAKLDKLKEAAP